MRPSISPSPADRATPIIEWEGHHGPRLDHVSGFDIIDCTVCDFAHAAPLPSEEDLGALYASAYYRDEKPTYLARAKDDEAWANLAIDERLGALEMLLPLARRRLLEVGSGPGFLLKRAEERGWTASGIDPSEQAVAHARSLGLDVRRGAFDDEAEARLGRADAIVMSNVLEHVRAPAEFLARAWRLLDSGGLITVTVPNDYNLFQETLRAGAGLKPWWVAAPHHLNYFNFESLSRLLERCGFAHVHRTTSFPMEIFALMGDLYPGNDVLGRACHEKRRRFDLAFEAAGTPEARRRFYHALAEIGLGREAILIARKD